MLHAKHLCKFSILAEKPTIPYASECTGSYGYLEYEFGIDEFFDLLYGNSFNSGRTRPFKVNRSD